MSERIFHKGTITLTYVSEESLNGWSMEQILEACDSGPAIAGPMTQVETSLTREQADDLACEYGSDREFFGAFDEEEAEI